jgi:hypothetical protein
MILRPTAFVVAVLLCASCSKKESDKPSAESKAAASAVATTSAAAAAAPAVPVPPGAPPADGKYERVTVDGVTVPMINVMNGGAVVLVDTDGTKPRSWEEQYKRKRDLPNGQYDLHKTNTNKNDTFEDDTIDKEGLWVIDAKGNITKH